MTGGDILDMLGRLRKACPVECTVRICTDIAPYRLVVEWVGRHVGSKDAGTIGFYMRLPCADVLTADEIVENAVLRVAEWRREREVPDAR